MKTKKYSILNSHYSLLLSIFFWLLAFGLQAQDYQWDWAKSGGGSLRIHYETSGAIGAGDYEFEHISDIVTDEDNNYYFLGKISHGNSHVDGNPVTAFGTATVGNNILITSFTCEGTYRWSRVIGGGGVNPGQHAYKLILDNIGGIYVSLLADNTTGTTNQGDPLAPTCFGDNDCLPYLVNNNLYEVQEGRKTGFLLKYDTDTGELLWRKDYQGNVNFYNNGVSVFDLQIDSNNVLHTIIGLQEGVHLDGTLTVELDEDEIVKYYLVKFNSTTGDLIGSPLLLPLEGIHRRGHTSFRYDENLNRYYLSGHNFSGSFYTVSFNGVTFGEPDASNNKYAYLLSFNPDDLQDWWYNEFTGGSSFDIQGITIDSNSDIYIGGRYFLSYSSGNTVSFGNYTFPESSSVSGNRPYILKMNSQGEVQWSKIPTGYIDPVAITGAYLAYDVAINGNEVALATHGRSTIWDSFSIDRPSGHLHDPYLIRFNKQTGEVIGLHDIMGSGGEYHNLTAVTADQDGNYVVGGYMRTSLFTDNPNSIATLYNTAGSGSYTDFFMARLAATECGTNVASNEAFYKPQIKLYPNPTNGLVYIDTQEDVQSYEVYNLLGQGLLSGNFNNNLPSFGGAGGGINMRDLSNGTYIVKVKMRSGEVMTSKVIKQ